MRRIVLLAMFCVAGLTFAVAADTIDWSQLGPAGTVLPSPQPWTSAGGMTGFVQVDDGGTFEVMQQGVNWNGNFTPGESLIWNGNRFCPIFCPPIGIWYPFPIFGGGAFIQANVFGPFTATLEAYDINFNELAVVTENGISNANGDGSAIFIGYQGDIADISYLRFSVTDINGNNDEAIGTTVIYTSAATPEPGSLILLGSGVLGLAGFARRRFLL